MMETDGTINTKMVLELNNELRAASKQFTSGDRYPAGVYLRVYPLRIRSQGLVELGW